MIRRFLRDTRAAIALEAVIITPILAWAFVGSFVFFDAFRAYSISVGATYAVADVLSRQTNTVYSSDIEGLGRVFQALTRNVGGSSIRVSEIHETVSGLRVEWSQGTGESGPLVTDDLPGIAAQLPPLMVGERVLVVESFLPYRPAFNVGIQPLVFENFTVTAPRFAGQILWNSGEEPGLSAPNPGS